MKIRSFLPLLTYPDAHSEASIRNAAALAGLVSAELHVVALGSGLIAKRGLSG